jgi:hypothetical protein
MTYELGLLEDALKEWRKLDNVVRAQFKLRELGVGLRPFL